jgi:hypothetical protein
MLLERLFLEDNSFERSAPAERYVHLAVGKGAGAGAARNEYVFICVLHYFEGAPELVVKLY